MVYDLPALRRQNTLPKLMRSVGLGEQFALVKDTDPSLRKLQTVLQTSFLQTFLMFHQVVIFRKIKIVNFPYCLFYMDDFYFLTDNFRHKNTHTQTHTHTYVYNQMIHTSTHTLKTKSSGWPVIQMTHVGQCLKIYRCLLIEKKESCFRSFQKLKEFLSRLKGFRNINNDLEEECEK